MSKNSCCDQKLKLKKGLWSPEEDEKLIKHVEKYGPGCWSAVPKQAGLQRCGKSCRLRWINYLRPDLKRGTFSPEEEKLIIDLQAELGNRWSQIATQLPGRTDNEIKNFWNSCLRKHLRETASDASTDHHGESISIREGSESTGSKDIIDASQRHIIYENPHIASDRNLPLVFQSAYNNPVIALLNQSADSSCAEWHIKGSDHNAISSEGFMCAAEMAHPPGMGVSDSFGSTGLLNKPLQINSELTFSREVGQLNTLIMANSTMFRRTSDSHGDQDSMGLLKWSDLVLPTACSSSTHGGIYNHSESKAEVVLFPENSADSKSIA